MNKRLKQILIELMRRTKVLKYASAKDFVDKLGKAGIHSPIKLYYQYKLPDGMSSEDLEQEASEIEFFLFYNKNKLDAISGLPDDEKDVINRYIISSRSEYAKKLAGLLVNIKRLNPILRDIKMMNAFDRIDFVKGVSRGFAPEDIDFFINGNESSEAFDKKLMGSLGFSAGFAISPNHQQEIMDAILAKKSGRNNSVER